MQCKPHLEAIANYLSDFITSLPNSTRAAVTQHIQGCLAAVSQEFNLLETTIKGFQSQEQDRAVEPTTE